MEDALIGLVTANFELVIFTKEDHRVEVREGEKEGERESKIYKERGRAGERERERERESKG